MLPALLKRVSVCALIIAATGCVSVIDVPQEKQKIVKQLTQASKDIQACRIELRDNPSYRMLYSKVALDPRVKPTVEQLSDTERPDAAMIQVAMDWFGDSQICIKDYPEKFGRLDPELGAYMTRNVAKNVALLNEIIVKKPTYGYINNKIQDLTEQTRAEAKRWAAGLDGRLKKVKAEQERAAAEQKKMVMSALGAIAETTATVLITAVAILANQQMLLAQAQAAYAARTPAYQPVTVKHTQCQYTGGNLYCTEF